MKTKNSSSTFQTPDSTTYTHTSVSVAPQTEESTRSLSAWFGIETERLAAPVRGGFERTAVQTVQTVSVWCVSILLGSVSCPVLRTIETFGRKEQFSGLAPSPQPGKEDQLLLRVCGYPSVCRTLLISRHIMNSEGGLHHIPQAATNALAPKATVGLKSASIVDDDQSSSLFPGKATDIELGFPALLIINYWKQKEDRKFDARINAANEPPPDYAPHRRYMVDWISEVGEQLDLQTVTIHSAVSFLDELMIIMNYSHRDWRLYAVCCLSVAAKYEEAECNMPMISELAEATEMTLSTPTVTRGELELVQRLQWDVSRVTAMHFLGYYTSQGVTMTDDTCQGRRLVDKVVVYMKKYVDFFANLCQQDYQFQRYRPSHIAAASILAARRALCIMPVWREELTQLTGYALPDVVECGEELWNFYEKMFPLHKPLRADPNATAAVVARKKAEQQQQQLAEAAALAATAMAAGAAPASGSDSRVGSTSADKRQPQQQPVAQPVMP